MNPMLLILGDDWFDRRQIPDLVPDRFGICPFQNVTTSSAMIGNAGNDLVALVRGNELPAVLGVSFLTALFSFILSRFRLRFWPCVWMLSAWRNGRILRCELLDFFFQFFDPSFQLSERSQENALTAGVISASISDGMLMPLEASCFDIAAFGPKTMLRVYSSFGLVQNGASEGNS